MSGSLPNIRLAVQAGNSARMAEEEAKEDGPRPVMRIEGGSAARMAELQAKEARGNADTQRHYGISMRVATGRPFNLDSNATDAPSIGAPEGGMRDQVQATPFRPISDQGHLPTQASHKLPITMNQADLNEETPAPSGSSLQSLRSLFSRISGTRRDQTKQSN
ncbi:MAG: hypothetical protein ABR905_20330 [Terracidiphilus sp.]|jgi:hypothetical protein